MIVGEKALETRDGSCSATAAYTNSRPTLISHGTMLLIIAAQLDTIQWTDVVTFPTVSAEID
jgi:hypothetical protein